MHWDSSRILELLRLPGRVIVRTRQKACSPTPDDEQGTLEQAA